MDYLLTIIKELRINDIIDILIIAFVLYRFYLVINFTRAIQLLKGIGIIILIFLISFFLEFRMVNFLLSNLITLGSLALIIIFQPELRRALEYLGRKQFDLYLFSDQNEPREHRQVDEIVQAIEALSAKQIGALIVLENDIGLKDIIESGTIIDARIDSQLLQNIFMPKAPLHDGATILRGERIVAAGCLLPLSSDRSVARDLGTRHRAALGMSAQSDALILIVSEETGVISYAQNSNLERFLQIEDVRNLLQSFYENNGNVNFKEMLKGGLTHEK